MWRARPLNYQICTRSLAKAGKRHRAREWVLRALYAEEMREEPGHDSLASLLLHDPPDEIDEPFARRLFAQVQESDKRYDAEIEKHLQNWDLKRLAIIDLLLLRCALVEMDSFPDIPHRVTLDETIELAKRYSGGQAGAFVNGVLDAIIKSRENKPEDTDTSRGDGVT